MPSLTAGRDSLSTCSRYQCMGPRAGAAAAEAGLALALVLSLGTGPWLAQWPELILATRARVATRKNVLFPPGTNLSGTGLGQHRGKKRI